MKKFRILLVLIFLTIILMSINVNSALVLNNSSELIKAYKNNSLVRLHVIANSNSAVDQYLKRDIRNQLLNYMGNNDYNNNLELKKNLNEIDRFINNLLEEKGANYRAKTELGSYFFPVRTYQDISLPAGRYKALKIVLGNGSGANWWCVLLPPMCIEDQSDINSKSKKIEFRFKLLEWFKLRNDNRNKLINKSNLNTYKQNNYRDSISQDKSLSDKILINKSRFYTMLRGKNNIKNNSSSFYSRFLQEEDYKFKDINRLTIY